MGKVYNPQFEAQKLLEDCGIDDLSNIDLTLFASGLNVILIEEELQNYDGKIIFGKNKTLIKINSKIQFEQRKRFVIAHEIGHLFLHKDLQLSNDTFENLNIVSGMEDALKNGKQELEANQFASELLMPHKIFLKEAKGKKFSPLLIKELSTRFNTSLTATVFRYLQLELHPICIVYIEKNKVKYWKKSEDLKVWFGDYNHLSPPQDSVAYEYIENNYDFLYKMEEKAQKIYKSTWFNLNKFENDSLFYEYCIPSKSNQTILSIIWED